MIAKFADKRSGWFGENCFKAKGRRFLKRLCRRYNRHYWNRVVKQDVGAGRC